MHRVYLAPYGVGLGHASRLALLAQSLTQPGIQFVFSTFGEAYNYLSGLGFRCNVVPPVEFLWGKNGEFSVKNNIRKIPQWLVNLPLQINKEIKYLMEFDPRVVVSDSRLSPLIAANILNKPRILIINQIKLLLTPRLRDFKATRLYETCNGELMGGMWNLANRILIPDLPPPYTISEETISTVKSIRNKMDYVGFITTRNKVSDKNIDTTKNQLKHMNSMPEEILKEFMIFFCSPWETFYPMSSAIYSCLAKIRVADGQKIIHCSGLCIRLWFTIFCQK